jgi:hypothetical protein
MELFRFWFELGNETKRRRGGLTCRAWETGRRGRPVESFCFQRKENVFPVPNTGGAHGELRRRFSVLTSVPVRCYGTHSTIMTYV